MKLNFKHQPFQEGAALAVTEVFSGQPKDASAYRRDRGIYPAKRTEITGGLGFSDPNEEKTDDGLGYRNAAITLAPEKILDNVQKVQRKNGLEVSKSLVSSPAGALNLTIEMETGTGKTYTYIKTMFEFNKRYGWSKFIVVVPSVAIREGVFKSFESTKEHFKQDYGKTIDFFIYDSKKLTDLDYFARSPEMQVMIINSQAFNATGKDARRIDMELDDFGSRKPIEVIAATRPILIIDEPQSVEGKKTKERLSKFNPLFSLRYSATHKRDSRYNMIYRLDALDAYNQKLVKRIEVLGTTMSTYGGSGYIYVESINVGPDHQPLAKLEFNARVADGVRKKSQKVEKGFNLYDLSGGLEEYAQDFVVSEIVPDPDDPTYGTVRFLNGKTVTRGDTLGDINEGGLRRFQIRETIRQHLEKEKYLYSRGIKVLSLFFIDHVDRYRVYSATGEEKGLYARLFEEEYDKAVTALKEKLYGNPEHSAYLQYLDDKTAVNAHQGYFSRDKKTGHFSNGEKKIKKGVSDDSGAYDLIMKDKEKLLGFVEPVRFIFSHSALREGWDNPNIFQICILKPFGKSEIRRRQEVGRGLRLAVNQNGIRQDAEELGMNQVQEINVLTVIANENYQEFAEGLQKEYAEALSDRPQKVTPEIFSLRFGDEASAIYDALVSNGYVHKMGHLTEKYREDKTLDKLALPAEVAPRRDEVIAILTQIANPFPSVDDAAKTITPKRNDDNFAKDAWKKLWAQINAKSLYTVRFDDEALIKKAIAALDDDLWVAPLKYIVEKGVQKKLMSKDELDRGESFKALEPRSIDVEDVNYAIAYDLIGEIVKATELTRRVVAAILQGIDAETFAQFKKNPEEFIMEAAKLINHEKEHIVIERIEYKKTDDVYDVSLFPRVLPHKPKDRPHVPTPNGRNLYDCVFYDSGVEKEFAEALERHAGEVEVYTKLPNQFTISTPLGKYNPDWAIALKERDKIKEIYLVAETKGTNFSSELARIERDKTKCARKHFAAISAEKIKYEVVKDYETLRKKINF